MIRYLKISFVLLIAIWALISLTVNVVALPMTYGDVHDITVMSIFNPGDRPFFATENPIVVWLFVSLLMLGKAVVLAFCGYGTVTLLRAVKSDSATFQHAKRWGILGGAVAVAWFFVGFVMVGEHIFFMFMDSTGRASAEAAFRYAGFIGIMTLFVMQPD